MHKARDNLFWGPCSDDPELLLFKNMVRAELAKGEAAELQAEAATAQSAAAKSQAVAQATCKTCLEAWLLEPRRQDVRALHEGVL